MRCLVLVFTFGIVVPSCARADSPDGIEFFEKKVRPIFVEHCLSCHGEKKQKGGLRLDTKAGWEKGGDTGPALVPGKAEKSLLVRMVKGAIGSPPQMPPDGVLPPQAVNDLVKWVEMGAPDPRTSGTSATARVIDWKAAEEFWAFRPLSHADSSASIDRWIKVKYEAAGLKPSPKADKATLIRRITFDLTGLPPTTEEVAAFSKDDSSDAYEKLIDRLLASKHYGEHQARYWLDLARYAEDQAHSSATSGMPHAWRYRDWVIEAFNHDVPYDRFVKLQLAADLMEKPEDDPADRRALGFLGLGAAYYKNNDIPKLTAEEWDDRVDTLTRTFLGLTVSCARCHDHKFDPIPTQDYYSIAGVIAGTKNVVLPVGPNKLTATYDAAVVRAAEAEQTTKDYLQAETDRVSTLKAAVLADYALEVWAYHAAKLDKPELKAHEFARAAKLDTIALAGIDAYLRKDRGPKHDLAKWTALLPMKDGPREPTAEVRELAVKFQTQVIANLAKPLKMRNLDQPKDLFGEKGPFPLPEKIVVATAKPEWQAAYAKLSSTFKELNAAIPAVPPQAHGVSDVPKPTDLKVYIRGNAYKHGEVAPRRFLRVLAGTEAPLFKNGSGRIELAEAIVDPKNPLTARVMVNRIWQQHFGRGIVGSPSNFGTLGERPTHPELLDALAERFIKGGWSVKKLHREIVLSETYQRSSMADAKALEADPENRWHARMPRRRLTVEAFRDAVLAVSDSLDTTVGGPSAELDDPKTVRRTLYGKVKRSELNPLLRLFDFPDPNITSERRTETTLPQQALFLINSPFMLERAKAFALGLAKESTPAAQVRKGYLVAFGRPPTDDEVKTVVGFLAAVDKDKPGNLPPPTRLERFAQALMASNEFVFID